MREIQRCKNPLRVSLSDFGFDGRNLYLFFGSAKGRLLLDHCERNRLTESQVGAIGKQLLQLLEQNENFPAQPQITDFIVQHVDDDGTPHIRLLDPDVSSLVSWLSSSKTKSHDLATVPLIGLLIFSMVLGQTDTDELEQHIKEGFEPISLRKVDNSVSRNVDAIFLASFADKTKSKYPTTQELAEDFECLARGEPLRHAKPKRRRWIWR